LMQSRAPKNTMPSNEPLPFDFKTTCPSPVVLLTQGPSPYMESSTLSQRSTASDGRKKSTTLRRDQRRAGCRSFPRAPIHAPRRPAAPVLAVIALRGLAQVGRGWRRRVVGWRVASPSALHGRRPSLWPGGSPASSPQLHRCDPCPLQTNRSRPAVRSEAAHHPPSAPALLNLSGQYQQLGHRPRGPGAHEVSHRYRTECSHA
jgi:hypothetical protein